MWAAERAEDKARQAAERRTGAETDRAEQDMAEQQRRMEEEKVSGEKEGEGDDKKQPVAQPWDDLQGTAWTEAAGGILRKKVVTAAWSRWAAPSLARAVEIHLGAL